MLLEVEHHCTVTSGIALSDFRVNHLSQFTKQVLNTVDNATEAYMVGVTGKFHILMLPLVS
jgi:hypothetical protein